MLSIWWASIAARSFPMAVVLGAYVQGFIFHHRIWVARPPEVARPPGGQTPEGGQTGWPDRSLGVGSWLLERLQIAGAEQRGRHIHAQQGLCCEWNVLPQLHGTAP